MNGPDGAPILGIEYVGDKPFSVQTSHSTYDFEWCKGAERLLYEDVGSGGDVYALVGPNSSPDADAKDAIWLAPNVEVEFWRGKRFRASGDRAKAALLERGYEVLDAPAGGNPFDAAEEGDTVYCTVCEDYQPGDSPCRHVVWVDGDAGLPTGGWCGCGAEESVTPATPGKYADSLRSLLKQAKAQGWGSRTTLLRLLRLPPEPLEDAEGVLAAVLRTGKPFELGKLVLDDEPLAIGLAWLRSLEPGVTKAAIKRTRRWLKKGCRA